jgi:23S rRNA G2445 N2-methylase RlmL
MKPTLPATISQMTYCQLEEHRQRYVQMNRLWAEMDITTDHYRHQRDETMAANTFIIDKIERHQQNRMHWLDEKMPYAFIEMAINEPEMSIDLSGFI